MKIICVEDGSIDIDAIETEGLKDGEILVYRQGATPPFVLDMGDANKDEELAIYKRALELENEERFKNIDGIWMIENGKRTKFINNAEELTNYFLDQAKKELEEQECVK